MPASAWPRARSHRLAAILVALLASTPFPTRADGHHTVHAGQSLARIARRYDVSVAQLVAANRLKADATLRVGQRLVIPGRAATDAERRWGVPRRPGVVTLVRAWSKERRELRLVNARGRVPPAAIQQLRQLLRPRNSSRRRDPAPRLLQLLADVSDHFGGREIHVVSGVRIAGGTTKKTSQHVQGHAIDFRIPGVPLQELHDYCVRFERVGVGLYPRSGFVHLDVRKSDARWTDWSGPGEEEPRPTTGTDGTEASPPQDPADDADEGDH